MIKKTLSYTDFNGESVKEDLYFNLNQVEQTRLLAKYTTGGFADLQGYIAKIQEKHEHDKIIALLEDIILSSYGERSADGRKFIKTKAVREEFEYSIAYAELFELLLTNPKEMEKFANGIFQKQQAAPVTSVTAELA